MIDSAQVMFAQVWSVVTGLSTSVQLAWIVWLLWGGAQIAWYRRARVVAIQLPTPRAKPAPAAATGPQKPAKPVRATGGSAEFLAALGLDEPSDKKQSK